ncbi:MAG: apolipoprotein N-acyltransferase [Betaproteobacteria bacterium]|nr:apolipoprotein N-acyltransferase [Betaproteobacteria bacterium]
MTLDSRRPLAVQLLLALVAGAIGVLAFAPIYFWPLALLSLFVLFSLWHKATTPKRAFVLGFFWGLGLFLAGVSWLYVSLHVYGNMPAPMAAGAILLFCCYLSLFPALAGWLQGKLVLRRRLSATISLLVVMPASFVAFEYLRGWFLTGFPWLTFGYTQTPGGVLAAPLAGFAPLFGAHGISWLLALTAAFCVLLVRPASGVALSRRGRTVAVTSVAVLWICGHFLHVASWSAPAGAALPVTLLQGNVEQSLKWREDQFELTLTNYLELANRSNAKLVVMPETALPGFLDKIPADYLNGIRQRALDRGADVLVGVPINERVTTDSLNPWRYFNSAISLGASAPQRYDKQHLVAFGEFIPPLFSWGYNWLKIPLAGFTPGSAEQQPMQIAGQKVAINICYEDAFGSEIARQLPAANLLVNVSNMAWYGRSLAADQHAQMSRMRAMETSRWMLRATNTGVTAAINERGEMVSALRQFERGALDVTAVPRSGATPYVLWRDWPVLIGLLLVLAWALFVRRREANPAAK